MAFNVNEFRSQMIGDGARPNLFEVSMPFPGSRHQETHKQNYFYV
jgi:hypothetical protein